MGVRIKGEIETVKLDLKKSLRRLERSEKKLVSSIAACYLTVSTTFAFSLFLALLSLFVFWLVLVAHRFPGHKEI